MKKVCLSCGVDSNVANEMSIWYYWKWNDINKNDILVEITKDAE